MKYLCLIYEDQSMYTKLSKAESDKVMADYGAFTDNVKKSGQYLAAEALQPSNTATTIRSRNGKLTSTDGPFAETKEQLAGYYILDCENLDEAIEWAAKIPTACRGGEGCIEIRPIAPIPPR
jgi:hypothetical protein